MKICFAFPDKNNSRIFYVSNSQTTNRLETYQEFNDLLYKKDYQNRYSQLFLTNPEDFRHFLEKNGYDYGLMIWNDIVQEFYITPRSLDYE